MKRKFYCLYGELYEGVQKRIDQLKTACLRLGVEFIAFSSIDVDYSKLPVLNRDDLIYNVARGSENLESQLLNEQVTSFYIQSPKYIVCNGDTTNYSFNMEKLKIPSPKTVFDNTNNKNKIMSYVSYMGGFPIVIKIKGGTLGVGTIIANDLRALFSITDYLVLAKVDFILREYIRPKEIARLIVVGNSVVASNRKFIPADDFRSSVKTIQPVEKRYDSESEQLAVDACIASNFETGGVDVIFDENGNAYVLEVNMPHDFVTTSELTKIDIAMFMVEHLINKSKR